MALIAQQQVLKLLVNLDNSPAHSKAKVLSLYERMALIAQQQVLNF
jgi:hypothetical protein